MHALAGRNSLSSVSVVSCRSTWHVHCSTPSVASSASNALLSSVAASGLNERPATTSPSGLKERFGSTAW